MPIPLKNIYICVVIVLITSFSNVFAENASYEVFKAYQSYSRNWMNRDAAAIATENFHTQVNINNEPIAAFDTSMIEQNYLTTFKKLKANDYWYSEEKLSFCKQSDSVYQIFNHFDRYKKDGSLLQGQLAATYIMEKRNNQWKFVYMSMIDQKWKNNGCDQYQNYEFMKKDKQFRESITKRWKGSFIQLDDGYTYFEQANSKAKEHIILVHGFSVPSYIWEPTYQEAIKRGYGVIRYDTYGRGFSNNPDTDYSTEFYTNQLINLMDALDIDKVNLVGLSDGGRTVAMMAAMHPERIDQLILVSPSGFHNDQVFESNNVSQDEVNEFISNAYPTIGQGQLSDFHEPQNFTNWSSRYNGLLKYQGFARALISTRKNYPDMTRIHNIIHSNEVKTSIIWGTHDIVLPLNSVREKLSSVLPNATLYELSASGHLPHMEEQERFNRILFEQILE